MRASSFLAWAYDIAECFEALALTLVPSRLTTPSLSTPIPAAMRSTCANTDSMSSQNCLRNVLIVSWSGCVLAATKRNATESYVPRSIARLEYTPVA